MDADIDAIGETDFEIVGEDVLDIVAEFVSDVEGMKDEVLGFDDGAPVPDPALERQSTEICAAPLSFLM